MAEASSSSCRLDIRSASPAPIYTRTTSRPATIPFSIYTAKLFVYVVTTCVLFFILSQISLLRSQSAHSPRWPLSFVHQWQSVILDATYIVTPDPDTLTATATTADKLEAAAERLREAVTFLPLKDLRFADQPTEGHTWFMSSLNDTSIGGGPQHQRFPSDSSKGRVLCLKGRDFHDGSRNYYALAWPEALPRDAIFMSGLTFVSYNHYDYDNIWHGLSTIFPFVAWHQGQGCRRLPERWVLYHWGELRPGMAPWLSKLMEATFGKPPSVEVFDKITEDTSVCFEDAVVTRHSEGGMSMERRIKAYELLRCSVRRYCNLSSEVDGDGNKVNTIRLTLLMRRGARSFRNESAVVGIFRRECDKVEGCRLTVAHSDDLSFCDQVKLMSTTDVLASPHGAQLTNLFIMDRNSSVMEFYPKGWLRYAGVGQYVYRWLSSWSGMRHQGAWRDPVGEGCPYPEGDIRCFDTYKNGKIGHNQTHFSEWTRKVLGEVKLRKTGDTVLKRKQDRIGACACN
ncbi:uncharacterized protein LOC115687889 [Syzygium oleosum]|uniref:uncharacterized protein LOC115687889 n=1 Tax=Syzygium oleosum TaxID=219896 RepID=UPI0024B8E5B1|nr:uncharacterized protein LOC115687889 [Syzygium oleosum]